MPPKLARQWTTEEDKIDEDKDDGVITAEEAKALRKTLRGERDLDRAVNAQQAFPPSPPAGGGAGGGPCTGDVKAGSPCEWEVVVDPVELEFDLPKIMRIIGEHDGRAVSIRDQNVAMMIGMSGVGKSMTMNYLAHKNIIKKTVVRDRGTATEYAEDSLEIHSPLDGCEVAPGASCDSFTRYGERSFARPVHQCTTKC
jgi:hypothetical protein